MSWIDDNKGQGPWEFSEQGDKPHYNEGSLISDSDNPTWRTDHLSFSDEPITPTHHPWCGYWHKDYPPEPPLLDCSCVGITIGYTTLQMSTGEEQVLTVENPVDGCIYSWAIAGGGNLSSSTGLSVVYTASFSNPNCKLNPSIIYLSCGDVCDSIAVATNEYTGPANAYEIREADCYKNAHWHLRKFHKKCDGTPGTSYLWCSSTSYAQCVIDCEPGKVTDLRTQAMKDGGCCPEALM